MGLTQKTIWRLFFGRRVSSSLTPGPFSPFAHGVKKPDEQYRKQNNLCSYKIKKAARELRGQSITEEITTKQVYNAINDITKPEQMARNKIKIEERGKTVEDPQEIAEIFKEFFPEKEKKLGKKLKKNKTILIHWKN